MLIGQLSRLGPASGDLGLAVLARFRPGLSQAQTGPDFKNCLFYVFNACFVLMVSRPISAWPRPRSGLNLAKTARPKSPEAGPSRLSWPIIVLYIYMTLLINK